MRPASTGMSAAERAPRPSTAPRVGRRMLTVLAGPVANFLLTIVVFAGVVIWQGVPTERPTIGAIAAAARRSSSRCARRRGARGERRAGRRASRTSTPRRSRWPDAGPMAVTRRARRRAARGRRRPTPFRRSCRASSRCRRPAGAGLRRGDVVLVGRRAAARRLRRPAPVVLASERPHHPARGLARRRRRSPSRSPRPSATPTTARAASSGG